MSAAGFNQNPEVIVTLLKAGANINVQNKDGWTPLMYAARHKPNPKVIIILLKAGADGRVKDHDGKTAFDCA